MPTIYAVDYLLCRKARDFIRCLIIFDGVRWWAWANLSSGVKDDIEEIRSKMLLLFASIESD